MLEISKDLKQRKCSSEETTQMMTGLPCSGTLSMTWWNEAVLWRATSEGVLRGKSKVLNSVVCQHGRERAWVFEVLGIWRKGQGTGHGGSLVGGRTRFDKDPGKEEKLQSSLWILGDVRVLPVTFMESSLTVCEEKIPVREEEPCRVECGSKVPVWARDFSQKNFTEGVRHEVTEWGDFYLSLEIFEWQINISCYCFDEEWKIRKMLQEKPYVIFRLYEWLSRPFQHVATRGWCSCDKWVASWDRHGANHLTCHLQNCVHEKY